MSARIQSTCRKARFDHGIFREDIQAHITPPFSINRIQRIRRQPKMPRCPALSQCILFPCSGLGSINATLLIKTITTPGGPPQCGVSDDPSTAFPSFRHESSSSRHNVRYEFPCLPRHMGQISMCNICFSASICAEAKSSSSGIHFLHHPKAWKKKKERKGQGRAWIDADQYSKGIDCLGSGAINYHIHCI